MPELINKKQPPFPDVFNGYNVCWGQGNNIVGPQLLASIPMYTLYPEGSGKRKKLEAEYWENCEKEYREAKKLYEENVFVGIIWKGNTDMSMKITKISFSDDKQYICSKPSEHACRLVEELSKKHERQYKPPPPLRITLCSFLTMIKNKSITIIHDALSNTAASL